MLKDLSAKLTVVVEKYATQKHFEVVLYESTPKTPVLWRAEETDITAEAIKLYAQGAKKR